MKKLLLLAAIAAAALTTGCARHSEGNDIGAKPTPTTPSVLTEDVLKEEVIHESILVEDVISEEENTSSEVSSEEEKHTYLKRYGKFGVANCTTSYDVMPTEYVWTYEEIEAFSFEYITSVASCRSGNIIRAVQAATGEDYHTPVWQSFFYSDDWYITICNDKEMNGYQFILYRTVDYKTDIEVSDSDLKREIYTLSIEAETSSVLNIEFSRGKDVIETDIESFVLINSKNFSNESLREIYSRFPTLCVNDEYGLKVASRTQDSVVFDVYRLLNY